MKVKWRSSKWSCEGGGVHAWSTLNSEYNIEGGRTTYEISPSINLHQIFRLFVLISQYVYEALGFSWVEILKWIYMREYGLSSGTHCDLITVKLKLNLYDSMMHFQKCLKVQQQFNWWSHSRPHAICWKPEEKLWLHRRRITPVYTKGK